MRLKDARGVALIASRLDRLAFFGHAGDAKAVGEGISELRIDFGPGYRICFERRGGTLVTQKKDIETAKRLSELWREEDAKKPQKNS